MRIQQVEIENFKRFERLSVTLGDLDCLVGANNSGKTTLLQSLALFDFCAHHCLHRKNGHLELRKRTIAPEEFYVLPVTNPMDLWHDRRAMERNKQRRIMITVSFDNGDRISATVKLDFNRFGVSIEAEDESPEALDRLKDLRIAYLPVFSSFLPREERRLTAAIEDELARGRVHSVVRNLLLEIEKGGRTQSLTDLLQRSFPGLEELRINFDEVTDRYINVAYREQGRPKEFDIFSAGSGFQQFLYLFGFILLRMPTVILLDEPDVHLHGSLQHSLLDELQRLVADNRQVLFATHSRELITRIPPEKILSLEQGNARRLALAFDQYDTLDRLGSLDPSQLVLVQAYRRVLVVEDRTDRELLSIFCRKVLGAAKWQQVERRVAFCYSRGNPWKQHDLVRLREILQQMIAVSGQPLQMFVIADRDYHPDRERLIQSMTRDGIVCHVWERAEIENYLLSVEALLRLIPRTGPDATFDDMLVRQEFDLALEASRNQANDSMVQALEEVRKLERQGWTAADMARRARERLDADWDTSKIALADAKEVTLPRMKQWFQEQGIGQFSDKRLAELLEPNDLPNEIHELAHRLLEFAGIN